MRKRSIATYAFMGVVVHWGYMIIGHWIKVDTAANAAPALLGIVLGGGTVSLASLLWTIYKENKALNERVKG